MLRIGAGPGEIEHKLAARMRFAEQRHRGREISRGIFQHEMLGLPAGARRGASGFFQRQEKFVPQKRLCAGGQRIPTLRINLRNAVEESRRPKRHAWAARGSAWVSASIRSRYLSASSAAMQPVPA